MTRTKEFDPDVALQSALDLFWERGYEATSMADLVERLGVARASIYATFGNKRALYLKALERYAQGCDARLLDLLSQPGPALPPVRALVREYAAESASQAGRKGCFVTNTAAELGPHDPAARQCVQRSWQHIETLLGASLVRAAAQGELPAGRDPRRLARTLVVLLQGMRVVGKVSDEPTRTHDAAEGALALLD